MFAVGFVFKGLTHFHFNSGCAQLCRCLETAYENDATSHNCQ